MSLRTYSLITHPAYLRYVEKSLFSDTGVSAHNTLLPRVEKIYDIAEYLKISHNTIRFLLINTPRYYRKFELKKKSGGTRTINAPRLFLKVVQWWIKDTILDSLNSHEAAHGFVKGRSFISNARQHIGATNMLNVDIASCFDSVDAKLVEQVFLRAGYSAAVSLQLAILCSLHGALPQGAPTSPGLLNQILLEFDHKMNALCLEHGLKYTRYADDLTFSGQTRIDGEIVKRIEEELSKVGLKLNQKKTRFSGPNNRKIVTGLALGKNRVNLLPKYLNSLRGWICKLERSDIVSMNDLQKLRGTLAMLGDVGGSNTEILLKRGRLVVLGAEVHNL